MVLDHPPGERAYCDYAGDTVPIYNYDGSVSFKAQIFVVTLAYSEYSYVCAHRSQDMALIHYGMRSSTYVLWRITKDPNPR